MAGHFFGGANLEICMKLVEKIHPNDPSLAFLSLRMDDRKDRRRSNLLKDSNSFNGSCPSHKECCLVTYSGRLILLSFKRNDDKYFKSTILSVQ